MKCARVLFSKQQAWGLLSIEKNGNLWYDIQMKKGGLYIT